MQLNVTTDYAIRTVLYLGSKEQCRTAKEISEEMCIPPKYLVKVLVKLRKGGIVSSIPGQGGGYQLEKSLSDIQMKDILEIMERTMKINSCLEENEFCGRNKAQDCSVHKFYDALQKELEEKWLAVSLQYILDNYAEEDEG